MTQLLWISLGSALGGATRYLLSGWVIARTGLGFPYGTLVVNLLGSLLMGALMHLGAERELLAPTTRLALTVGMLGGFTTFSTFSYETLRALQSGSWAIASMNVLANAIGCLGACWLGWLLAHG